MQAEWEGEGAPFFILKYSKNKGKRKVRAEGRKEEGT